MYGIVECKTGALYEVHQDTNRVRSTSDRGATITLM